MCIDLRVIREEFCLVRIPLHNQEQASADNASSGPISCRLLQSYRGEPTNFHGEFHSENMIVWRVLQGSVRQLYLGEEFQASPGEWMVSNACRRRQDFSDDARIISIHLHINPGRAEWHGPRIVAFADNRALQAAARLLLRLHAQSQASGITGYAELQSAMWGFFGRLTSQLSQQGMELRNPRLTDERVRRTMEMIERTPLSLPWNREGLATASGLSPSQLDRLWRSACGHTPYAHWDLLRIRFAREKLENTDWTIKAIASELGFSQLAQFSNWFRDHQRISPRIYRERLG